MDTLYKAYPDNKVHGVNIGPIWDRHVGPMKFAIWAHIQGEQG